MSHRERPEGGRPTRGACPAVVALSATVATAATAAAQTIERDVPYVADTPHAEQHLDIHWPAAVPSATVLFVHGGSLHESGERRSSPRYADVCEPFVDVGLACATTDYRLLPSFRWPAMAVDVAAAVREVRDRLVRRGASPERLFLFGHSSGCHLTALLGTNPAYLAEAGLEPGDLAGIVPMGCTLDRSDAALRGLDADDIREAFGSSSDDIEMFGTAEGWISANPAHWVGPHVPPTLVVLAHEERFFPAILEQGARFVRLLKEADVPADLLVVPGTHRSSIEDLDEPGNATFGAILAFIEQPTRVGGGG